MVRLALPQVILDVSRDDLGAVRILNPDLEEIPYLIENEGFPVLVFQAKSAGYWQLATGNPNANPAGYNEDDLLVAGADGRGNRFAPDSLREDPNFIRPVMAPSPAPATKVPFRREPSRSGWLAIMAVILMIPIAGIPILLWRGKRL